MSDENLLEIKDKSILDSLIGQAMISDNSCFELIPITSFEKITCESKIDNAL
jgi:hypothetical protein